MKQPRLPESVRFWSRVRKGSSVQCWEWHGPRTKGYGYFSADAKLVQAHRWSYAEARGPIPAGATIDHLCRNRACVNPAHLEAVSRKENVLRGIGYSAINARKTECLNGHPLTGENVYLDRRGSRHCRTCRAERTRASQAARKTIEPPSLRTHCPKGHAYEGANLRITSDGKRECVTCRRANKQRIYNERHSKGLGLPATRTHCPHGHPYDGDNLIIMPGRRICRTCKKDALKRWRDRQK